MAPCLLSNGPLLRSSHTQKLHHTHCTFFDKHTHTSPLCAMKGRRGAADPAEVQEAWCVCVEQPDFS